MAEVKINPRTYSLTLEEWEAEELLNMLGNYDEGRKLDSLYVSLRETLKISRGDRA